MKPTNSIIKAAIDEAKKSNHLKRVGAVIFDKRIIVSKGRNYSLKSAKKLHPKFTKYKGAIHAEVSAILNARCDLRGMNILVVRLGLSGKLRYSKPCPHCMKYIEFVGIRNAYYIGRNFDIKRMKI